jgi:hypothetical protein
MEILSQQNIQPEEKEEELFDTNTSLADELTQKSRRNSWNFYSIKCISVLFPPPSHLLV